MWRGAPKDPVNRDHEAEASEQADDRGERDELERLDPLPSPEDRREASFGNGAAGIAADERVGGARWQAEEPGDQVPDDRAEQAAQDHVRIDEGNIDHPFADRARNGRP